MYFRDKFFPSKTDDNKNPNDDADDDIDNDHDADNDHKADDDYNVDNNHEDTDDITFSLRSFTSASTVTWRRGWVPRESRAETG